VAQRQRRGRGVSHCGTLLPSQLSVCLEPGPPPKTRRLPRLRRPPSGRPPPGMVWPGFASNGVKGAPPFRVKPVLP
jgi:hypothetical protein